jgi:hypothetical protein
VEDTLKSTPLFSLLPILAFLSLPVFADVSNDQTNIIVSTNYSLNLFVGVSQKKVPENGTFTVDVILTWKGNRDINLVPPVLSGTRNCEITGNSVEDSSQNTNGLTVHKRIYSYILKPLGLGQAYFGAVSLKYTEKQQQHELMTMDFPVTVIMAEIPRKNNGPFILLLFVIAMLLGAGAWYGVKALRSRKEKKEREKKEAVEKSVTHEEKVFPEFTGLLKDRASLKMREYFDRLIKFLKDYLRVKWNINRRGVSDAEFMQAVPENAPNRANIQEYLGMAHEYRYANVEPDEKDITRLEKLIEEILKTNL